jgi:hypothetical protein
LPTTEGLVEVVVADAVVAVADAVVAVADVVAEVEAVAALADPAASAAISLSGFDWSRSAPLKISREIATA